ncbi:helix-turn-helix domain-containing protein [Streptomyces sp. NPDC048349]|uniref:helix-turn-helix domain-containing protein n=1 Tax=Streptomyces sp. NPDC048349 TaxID=3155486 RepID=UPI0034484602
MALQHLSAPSRAASRVQPGTARSGVIHVNTRHTSHYTVVGNHLLQHRDLSATAIGIAAYIQSLPDGAPVGIKALAGRFPEGEIRIGSALRELERHGYLERRRERLESGRMVTRTFSCNMPGAVTPDAPSPTTTPPPPPPPPPPVPDRGPRLVPGPGPGPGPESEPVPVPGPMPPPDAGADAEPAPEPAPEPGPEPVARNLHPGAVALLVGLRRLDPRLLLAERDVRRLAPGVSVWLERGADPHAVAQVLAGNLPEPLRSPAAVLAYRLTALVPPPLPPAPAPAPARPVRRPDPIQTCDGCERGFRAAGPGLCRDCREAGSRAPAA